MLGRQRAPCRTFPEFIAQSAQFSLAVIGWLSRPLFNLYCAFLVSVAWRLSKNEKEPPRNIYTVLSYQISENRMDFELSRQWLLLVISCISVNILVLIVHYSSIFIYYHFYLSFYLFIYYTFYLYITITLIITYLFFHFTFALFLSSLVICSRLSCGNLQELQ